MLSGDAGTRTLHRIASPELGRYVVISDADLPGIFYPSEIPINARIVELSNPVAVTDHTPFGFCEVVTYNHAKGTRTIYTTCNRKTWTERTELCHKQAAR
jgi:hypothetical protein